MPISVVIPTLNEATHLIHTLARVREAGECQIIVVDGGSGDGTPEVAGLRADVVLSATRGRARQMNAGAKAAVGDILLFLHADTILPHGFPVFIEQALRDPQVIGGHFEVHLDAPRWRFRMIETLMNLRSRLTRIATGDQAIFIRRDVFFTLGGYPEVELMEDIELSRKLKRTGKMVCLRERVLTSARRWQRNGVIRTIVLMWTLRLGHFLGVPPEHLKAFYGDTR